MVIPAVQYAKTEIRHTHVKAVNYDKLLSAN